MDTVTTQAIYSVRDENGFPVPFQGVRAPRTNNVDTDDTIFRVTVPVLGYRLYWIFMEKQEDAASYPLHASETVLENDHIKAKFHKHTGELIHLIDKHTGFDALTGRTGARLMDIEPYDTWAHKCFRFDKEAGAFSDAEITLLEAGPVRAVLEVKTHFATSVLRYRYVPYADADLHMRADVLHQPLPRVVETYHVGPLGSR